MRSSIFGLCFLMIATQSSWAQTPSNTSSKNQAAEQELINLSKEKWQWMTDKNVDKLAHSSMINQNLSI